MLRRAALLWLLLFAAYAGTVGINAFGSSNYGGDEPHYLLTAESIVSDGDVDLTDEYRTRAYADWYPTSSTSTANRRRAGSTSRTASASRSSSRPPTRSAGRWRSSCFSPRWRR